ncbi:MAG: hypothetical protein FWE24_00425 [Defluviitaleaceae bacterium]|nr:hypothetical protein [Defluviitaleaceae bacterium]
MKKLLLTLILAVTVLILAGCLASEVSIVTIDPPIEPVHPHIHVDPIQGNDSLNLQITSTVPGGERGLTSSDQLLKIGVTHAHHDNVGQILRFFGAGVDFYELSHSDLSNLEKLSEFFAVFINCGSHNGLNSRILRAYVEQGGIVYASDLAGEPLAAAFPDMFEYMAVEPSLTVRNADIVHSSLASHMRINQLDVVFNMGGWYVITNLAEEATTYISGHVPNHGTVPLAISFNYGEGTVFYTSFHNSAQVTSNMINFIEYLIFRIKFIEADRSQTYIAAREGFDFQGQVFGFLRGRESAADQMAEAGVIAAAPAASEPAPSSEARESFQYTFNNGENFMLMIESGGESFTLRLNDPLGNVFYISERGELISQNLISGTAPVFEGIDGFGVRVRNVTGGEWRFRIIADDAPDDATFAVGIATQAN